MTYNYSELCGFFGEQQIKNRRQRDQQIERWRRNYDITRIEGTYKYTLMEKPKSFETPITKKITYADLLEPMILQIFADKDTTHLGITQQELQQELGFVNDNFRNVVWDFDLREIVAKKLNIDPSELSKYRSELYELNRVTINNVIKHLEKLGVLFVDNTYKITLYDGTIIYADDEKKTEILEYRNKIASVMAHGLLYNQVKDENLSKRILEQVNRHFQYKNHYSAMMLHLDLDSIRLYIAEHYANYNTYEQAKHEVNTRTQDKAIKSKRGELKFLPTDKKKTLVKELIKLDD